MIRVRVRVSEEGGRGLEGVVVAEPGRRRWRR